MIRNVIRGSLALVLLTVIESAPAPALAGEPLSFHMSGTGVFKPANIGTPKGGDAGLVLGDGSGLAPYTGSGTDFLLDGFQLGDNTHVGAVQSFTQGTLGTGVITWPAEVARNPEPPKHGDKKVHVTHTDFGDIYFTYTGRFILNLSTGGIVGQAGFEVTGGTGLFEKADGFVSVVVTATGPAPSGGVGFQYEFDGFITLDD